MERGHRDAGGMSSRLSFSQYRLEAEVERCRAECQWDKIPSLLEQLAAARLHDDGKCACHNRIELNRGEPAMMSESVSCSA